jgi:hypothetical protein
VHFSDGHQYRYCDRLCEYSHYTHSNKNSHPPHVTMSAHPPPISATCHCRAVEVTLPHAPDKATNCNCSACRRYGTLWAYYPADEVVVRGHPAETEAYVWGDKTLRFVRCRHCGCVTHWEPIERKPDSRMGVNLRNFDPAILGDFRVRLFDGATTWTTVGEAASNPHGFAAHALPVKDD